MLKFDRSQLVFQEVPDEITIAYALTCCPGTCEGCHSSELRANTGTELTEAVLRHSIENAKFATCVLLLGGDNDIPQVVKTVEFIKSQGLKTAVYSGRSNVTEYWNLDALDYLKLGPWISRYGPLGSRSGNQVMYRRDSGAWVDITYRFRKL